MSGTSTRGGSLVHRVVKAVPPHDPNPSTREIGERERLAEEVRGSLERVRKMAENWRIGVAGLISLVAATLIFKGQNAITGYVSWVRYVLGGLAAVAVGVMIASLWLFLSAAYGRMRAVSAQSILDEGGSDVRNLHLATTALNDLWWAQRLALCGAALLAAAVAFSWYGPLAAKEPIAYAKVVVRRLSVALPDETLCGALTALSGTTTVLKIEGEPDARRLPTQKLVSLVLVTSCRSDIPERSPADAS